MPDCDSANAANHVLRLCKHQTPTFNEILGMLSHVWGFTRSVFFAGAMDAFVMVTLTTAALSIARRARFDEK